ncbi:hypothetical protein DFH08DRAFT_1083785 [Mycena albidolilacea]|uniref:DUF1793-domain-containing protein n=1 Tax=Mycena albidolilacea TaxID=1033008 RepID=A0AAD6ZQS8_9AGAR|nr:hypothetical protein DFH08DRAFT_1083785 [Mycena albidolilacea]
MLYEHTLISLGILLFWSNWITLALTQQTFFPSAVPLAVRTPTFNCWLDTRNGTNPIDTWPTFWNDQHILGWAGYIKVDGTTYRWLGSPVSGIHDNASVWLATEVTPTRTILTVQAGPMLLNVTFLSPIEPSDWARQSFPFSYVYLDGKATDGQQHSIQLYSDISGEWVTKDLETGIQWSSSQTSNTVFHQVKSTTPKSSFEDVAEDAVAYHAISSMQPGLVSLVGSGLALRAQFSAAGTSLALNSDLTGNIGNVKGTNGKFPVFAHALNLGTTDTLSTVAWAVGVVRDPVLTFSGVQRRAYYWSQHSTIGDAIDAFITDFQAARARAIALDQKVLQDAVAISPDYADLVSLGTRQAMAGVEITLSILPDGSFNMSDVKAFMKDVGNSRRVNPTETIYAALPAFMYLDANITGVLLEPLLEYQSSSSYGNSYAAPDLGTTFPSVPGNPDNNAIYGVENSGNMLILVLAHARSTGDGSLIVKYYNLLKRWADYLTSNVLDPEQQTTADDTGLTQTHGNVTNLALKGIIAIQAMAGISQIMGQTPDVQKYERFAKSLMQTWVNLTATSGQLRWTYGDSTFGLMYNLLADKLLKLNVVPTSIYTAESTTLSNNPAQAFGFALSSDSNSNTRSDWTLFSAAAAPDIETRNLLISGVHKHASSNLTNGTFPTLYNVLTGLGPGAGVSPNGFGSPAQGAMFSVLALNVANKTVVVPSPPASRSKTGVIAGGVVGGVALLLLLGIVVVIFLRWRRHRQVADGLAAPRPYMTTVFGGSSMAPTNPSSNSLAVPPSRPAGAGSPFISPKAALMSGVPGHVAPEPTLPPASSQLPSSSVPRGTEELRSEMERLRHEVEQLCATQGVPQEAPPVYH